MQPIWPLAYTISAATVTFGTGATTQSQPYIATKQAETSAMKAAVSTEGTSNPMAYDERLVDAKLAAGSARTDSKFSELLGHTNTKFAEVLGELRVISTNVTHLSSQLADVKGEVGKLDTKVTGLEGKTSTTRVVVVTTILGAFLGMVGIVWAALTYGIAAMDFITNVAKG